MLYGNRLCSYHSNINLVIWTILALQGGMLNVMGLMSGQHIVSHITGIVTHMGILLTQIDFARALILSLMPLFFLIGCVISALMIDHRIRTNRDPKYFVTFGIMLLLLGAILLLNSLDFFTNIHEPIHKWRGLALLSMLCLICGIQNATITTVSRSVIRTTHLTGLVTDLGVGLVRLWKEKNNLKDWNEECRINMTRILLVNGFIAGVIIGAMAYQAIAYRAFIIPTFITGGIFLMMLIFRWRR